MVSAIKFWEKQRRATGSKAVQAGAQRRRVADGSAAKRRKARSAAAAPGPKRRQRGARRGGRSAAQNCGATVQRRTAKPGTAPQSGVENSRFCAGKPLLAAAAKKYLAVARRRRKFGFLRWKTVTSRSCEEVFGRRGATSKIRVFALEPRPSCSREAKFSRRGATSKIRVFALENRSYPPPRRSIRKFGAGKPPREN